MSRALKEAEENICRNVVGVRDMQANEIGGVGLCLGCRQRVVCLGIVDFNWYNWPEQERKITDRVVVACCRTKKLRSCRSTIMQKRIFS